jgi:hypothetical protein
VNRQDEHEEREDPEEGDDQAHAAILDSPDSGSVLVLQGNR